MKFHRKEYVDLMTFVNSGRPMFVELFGPLIGLDGEWKAQGATLDEINMIAFDWDYVPVVQCGAITGITGGVKKRIIEETDKHIIEQDELGRRIKLCKGYSTQFLPLDYPVKDMDSTLL